MITHTQDDAEVGVLAFQGSVLSITGLGMTADTKLKDVKPAIALLVRNIVGTLDKNGDGNVDGEELVDTFISGATDTNALANQNHQLKGFVMVQFLFLFLLSLTNLGTSVVAVYLARDTAVSGGVLVDKASNKMLKTGTVGASFNLAGPAEEEDAAGNVLGCLATEEVETLKTDSFAIPATLSFQDGSVHSIHAHDWVPDAEGVVTLTDMLGQEYIIRPNDPACSSVDKNGRRLEFSIPTFNRIYSVSKVQRLFAWNFSHDDLQREGFRMEQVTDKIRFHFKKVEIAYKCTLVLSGKESVQQIKNGADIWSGYVRNAGWDKGPDKVTLVLECPSGDLKAESLFYIDKYQIGTSNSQSHKQLPNGVTSS